ncbi:hypothetical protein AAMO2058_001088000 [Amorphochlora amoebiformis]
MSDEGGFQNETFSNLADLHSLSRPSLLPSNSFCSGPLSMFQLGGLGLPKSSGTFKPYEPSLHKSKSRGQITDSHSGGKRRKSEHAESLKDDQNFLSSLNRDTSNTLPLSPPLSPTSMFLGPRSDSVITLRDDELSEAEEYLPSMHPQRSCISPFDEHLLDEIPEFTLNRTLEFENLGISPITPAFKTLPKFNQEKPSLLALNRPKPRNAVAATPLSFDLGIGNRCGDFAPKLKKPTALRSKFQPLSHTSRPSDACSSFAGSISHAMSKSGISELKSSLNVASPFSRTDSTKSLSKTEMELARPHSERALSSRLKSSSHLRIRPVSANPTRTKDDANKGFGASSSPYHPYSHSHSPNQRELKLQPSLTIHEPQMFTNKIMSKTKCKKPKPIRVSPRTSLPMLTRSALNLRSSPRTRSNSKLETKSQKNVKGLKFLSRKICETLSEVRSATQDTIISKLCSNFVNKDAASEEQSEKSVRRRIYDTLNVLVALGLVRKDKQIIEWQGSTERVSEAGKLEKKELLAGVSEIRESLAKKRKMLLEEELQYARTKALLDRNLRSHSLEQELENKQSLFVSESGSGSGSASSILSKRRKTQHNDERCSDDYNTDRNTGTPNIGPPLGTAYGVQESTRSGLLLSSTTRVGSESGSGSGRGLGSGSGSWSRSRSRSRSRSKSSLGFESKSLSGDGKFHFPFLIVRAPPNVAITCKSGLDEHKVVLELDGDRFEILNDYDVLCLLKDQINANSPNIRPQEQ